MTVRGLLIVVMTVGATGCTFPWGAPPKRLATAAIVLHPTPGGAIPCAARTAPQRIQVRRADDVEWTIVNLCNIDASSLVIQFQGESPAQQERLAGGDRIRTAIRPNAAAGVHKYRVLLNAVTIEDPELEIIDF